MGTTQQIDTASQKDGRDHDNQERTVRWLAVARRILVISLGALLLTMLLTPGNAQAQDLRAMGAEAQARLAQIYSRAALPEQAIDRSTPDTSARFVAQARHIASQTDMDSLAAMGRQAALVTLAIESMRIELLQESFCRGHSVVAIDENAREIGCQLLEVEARMNTVKRRAVDMLVPGH